MWAYVWLCPMLKGLAQPYSRMAGVLYILHKLWNFQKGNYFMVSYFELFIYLIHYHSGSQPLLRDEQVLLEHSSSAPQETQT